MFVIQQTAKICKRLYTRPYSFKKMSSFDTKVIDTKDLSVAVEALKRGDVVAFPTGTILFEYTNTRKKLYMDLVLVLTMIRR